MNINSNFSVKYMHVRDLVLQKPRVLLVTTGGTITMLRGANGSLYPCEDAGMLLERIPELNTLADIDILPLTSVDSSDITPAVWLTIARAIFQRIKEYDGFVVTHGTDTLCYTAAALSFMLQELSKPVIITGSQVPLEEIGSDGRANLINAVRVAISDLAEVAVVFGSLIIRGTRAKKTSVFDMQAFISVNDVPLGTIGLAIKFSSFAKTRSRRKPLLRTAINENVALIPVYPGMKPCIIEYIAGCHDGIVLEGYGAGNIPTGEKSLIPAISQAVARNVPVVVCTQCIVGSTEMELYQVGRAALEAGAIPAMDMTPEATLVKLMWVLGQTDDMGSIDSMMQKCFVGELHEVS
ncbi:MAG: L-asparaginase 1 [Candidatus Riflebacteria bacterium HGW-Riflebacteria-2]|nr:MAG: L-asparaginase 1 [Candidatus Riflebacteria bacterium HGW-Riflebacteria-2]